MKPKDWAAFAVLGVVWGSSFLWIKIAVQDIGPFTLVAFRLLFGWIGLLVAVLAFRPESPDKRRKWLFIAVMGLTNTAAPFVLISWGQQFIDSGVASILNGTVPLFTMVIAHFFLVDERMTWARVLGLLTGFVGVLLLVTQETGEVNFRTNLLGHMAVLGASLSYACSAVFARRTLRGISPILQSFVSVAFADLLIWLSVPVFESPIRMPEAPLTWMGLLWLGLLGTCLAYVLYYYLIQSVGSTRTMLVTYVLPVVGLALGVLFLGERVNLQLAIGGSFVLAGVWVVNTNWRPRIKMVQ